VAAVGEARAAVVDAAASNSAGRGPAEALLVSIVEPLSRALLTFDG
jgi:hypothetical protein